jgi:hypothetical protein
MSLELQPARVMSIFVALIAANFVRGYISVSDTGSNILNIAGRQRMLSQTMSKQAFPIANGGGTAARDALGATATEFGDTLNDLINGNAERDIVAPDSEQLSAQLEEISTSTHEPGLLADSLSTQIRRFELGTRDPHGPWLQVVNDPLDEEELAHGKEEAAA